jgi:hypothetical protein
VIEGPLTGDPRYEYWNQTTVSDAMNSMNLPPQTVGAINGLIGAHFDTSPKQMSMLFFLMAVKTTGTRLSVMLSIVRDTVRAGLSRHFWHLSARPPGTSASWRGAPRQIFSFFYVQIGPPITKSTRPPDQIAFFNPALDTVTYQNFLAIPLFSCIIQQFNFNLN